MESAAFDPALRGLGDRLERIVGEAAAASAMRMVRERAPDERLAAALMLRLGEQSPSALAELLRDPARAGDLAFCLGSSELVGDGLCASGGLWRELFERARDEPAAALIGSIRVLTPAANDRIEAARLLAECKRQFFLLIAIGDLLGRLSAVDTTAAMSRLADECVRAALEAAERILAAQGLAAGDFCVIAMGKLGAGELNLSSDIDLMYLCGENSDPVAARRMGETITEIISAGCFRTDLRLRPGGRNSPLVVSLEAALNFYQNFGQTWERAALLRARPVAGALELGREMIAQLSRFIYRGYLDFDTLRQLRAMKRRIERELRSPALVDRDIKLGYGGIRELEFIVQALMLIYGGRDPRLRAAGTLAALDRLEIHGYMAPARVRALKAAYLFLRNVEHKLQVAAGLQTHALPPASGGLAVLAARMGFGKNGAALERFQRALLGHRELVAGQFREMLAGGEEPAEPASSAALAAWRAASEPPVAAAALEELGFGAPRETAGHLELLARGPSHSPASPRRRELLESLGPALLDEIAALADPDLALMNLASFIAAIGARTSFLSLLEQHPATRRVLLRLFASSGYLSSLFIRHPELLDTLVRSDLARPRRAAADLSRELAELLAACADFESRLDAIRSFRHQEFLRIAIADLAGDLTLDEAQSELTALAETVLSQAFAMARDEVNERRPVPVDLRLCAIGMGRLGAREMSYNSDLDLIFIYAKGETPAGRHEAASRIVQKLIAILEARTREGYAYKIDLRLRPSGNAGPLVAPLDGFREYHRRSAAVWERQSLVRARVIAGDPRLAEEVEEARRQFVFERGLTAEEVGEIAAMRERMEREIGAEDERRLNLKQGRGGLVDVEFIAQMMALRYGNRLPAMRQRETVAQVRAIGGAGLLPREQADQLEADYRFLTRLENRLRIETDQAAWALPTNHEQLTPIARRMGYDGINAAAQLLYEVEERRSRIREIFEALFARERTSDDGRQA